MVATLLQFAPFLLVLHLHYLSFQTTTCNQLEVVKGFSAVPASTVSSFQPILNDPSLNFSLGFLRLNQNQLALAILHLPSSQPLWLANPTHFATWSHTTQLFFNGTLVLSDPQSNLLWSTHTHDGHRLLLLNTSNLQVLTKAGDSIWQSFDFPTNTLVQDQNLTSRMSLLSSNALYSLRLGADFMGLYANYGSHSPQLYWKHTALEAKADIVEGKGPIYARVNSDGYLAMYQTGTKPVDVQKFNTFQRPLISSFLLVRLEPDGNLKGYYWDTSDSNWVLNYQAIDETCDLPNPCGSYGLCTPGASGCSCLDNGTSYSSSRGGCLEEGYGDLCGEGIAGIHNFEVVRRVGVEAAHKELMKYETASSVEGCEEKCEKNCKCWGALYYNGSGYCYMVEHPIQTMLGTGDESKVGYFKVRKSGGGRNNRVGAGVVGGMVGGAVVIGGMIGVGCYVVRRKRRRGRMMEEEGGGASPGPYKNLGSASFRCIEMSNSNSQ